MPLGDYSGMQRFGQNLSGLGAQLGQNMQMTRQRQIEEMAKNIIAMNTTKQPDGQIVQDKQAILAELPSLGTYGIEAATKLSSMWGMGGSSKPNEKRFGLEPIWGRGQKNELVPMRMEEGGLTKLDLPEGVVEATPGVQKIDLGNRWGLLDKGGFLVGYQDKGIPPQEQPQLKGAQAEAVQKATGKISETEKKMSGKESVAQAVSSLKGFYEKLNEMGGIQNVDESVFHNMVASVASSGFGQKIGKITGTKEQSVRNMIESMRPTLLGYIRQASNMGAKGLDSEKELEFYLKAATDPKIDLQANFNALKVLNEAYGLTSTAPTAYEDSEKERRYQEWKRKQGK